MVFAGERGGDLVVATRHEVREGPALRSYLVIHGALERLEQGVAEGAHLDPGAALGHAALVVEGGHLVTITLEARQVRAGATLGTMDEARLSDSSVSVPIDLRNVLSLR